VRHSKAVAALLTALLVLVGTYTGYSASASTQPYIGSAAVHPTLHQPSGSAPSSPTGEGSPARSSSPGSGSSAVMVVRSRSQVHVAIAWSNGLGVTLDAVFNPAAPLRRLSAVPRALHLFAIKFSLRNSSKKPIVGDVFQDVSAVGASFAQYPGRAVRQLSECGDFNAGHYVLRPGSTVTGCATFALPTGAKVDKVLFAPDGARSRRGLWDLS